MYKLSEASLFGLEMFGFELSDKFNPKTYNTDADLQLYILLNCFPKITQATALNSPIDTDPIL